MPATHAGQVRYQKVKPTDKPNPDVSVTSDPDAQARRSWRAVVLMATALLAGIIIAVAQHFTNAYLDGHEINSVRLSQSWVTRMETALAFLVKTCLVVATGAAFVQCQWLILRRKPLKVQEIDTLTGVLGNVFNFFDVSVWFHHWLLTLIAVITWTIPLAAIVTPGSLSVEQKPKWNITNLPVPQHDWTRSANYGQPVARAGLGPLVATATTYQIAYVAAMTAKTVSLPFDFQNESYHLNFYGPAVKCGMANQSLTDTMGGIFRNPHGTLTYIWEYLSWVPGDEENIGLTSATATNFSNEQKPYVTIDQTSTDGSRIFIMTNNNWTAPNLTVSECLLYNATYNVKFDFSYPNQTQDISVSQYLNSVPASGVHNTSQFGNPMYRTIQSYGSVMEAFGKLLVGDVYTNQYANTAAIYFTSYNLLSINWTYPELTQRGLESLFRNITVSLLSNTIYTKTADLAALVPVNATTWPVTYVYSPKELWIPYGLSCAITLACVLVGVYAFIRNNGSYQNTFSSFVRATSNKQEIQSVVRVTDNAADPLPEALANMTLNMKSGK